MSTRTDALVSQQETGKITASIIPIAAGCHPARAITTCETDYRSNSRLMALARPFRALPYVVARRPLEIIREYKCHSS
jgi:hypothetical protein